MVLGPYKLLLHTLVATMLGVALLIGGALLLLSSGPLSVGFATPYIERALASPESPNVIRVRDTVIALDTAEPSINLRAIGIRVFDRERVRLVATAPSLDVRLSIRALLRGLLAPAVVEIEGPTLRVQRQPGGTISIGFTSEDGKSDVTAASTGLLGALLLPPDPSSPTGYLRKLGIVGATVRVDDRVNDARWTLRDARVSLRRDAQAIDGELTARLDVDGLVADLSANGSFDIDQRTTDVAVSFDGLQPAALAAVERHVRELQRAEMPIDGTLAMQIDSSGTIESVGFELIGGPGTVDLPEFYDEPLFVDALFVKGVAASHFDRLTIEEAFLDLGGVTGSARGILVRTADNRLIVNAEAETAEVPISEIERIWPLPLVRPARRWVMRNLADGIAQTADIKLRGESPVDAPLSVDAVEISGGLEFSGMTVHYLRPMTPVKDAIGTARFDNESFNIALTSGTSEDLVLEQAAIQLVALDTKSPAAEIELTVAGPADAALALLDEEPLRFTRALGLDPTKSAGEQRTNAVIRVPLVTGVTPDQVEAAAAARISGFAYEPGIFGLPVENGELTLEVDREQLHVAGELNLEGTPLQVAWTRGLTPDAPVRERYQLRGFVDDGDRARLGVVLPGWITGPVGVGLTYTASSDTGGIGAAEVDLTNAVIDLAPFDWHKNEGEEAGGRFEFLVENDIVTQAQNIALTGPSLVAEGDMTFAADGSFDIDGATFSRLRIGETDVAGSMQADAGHYEIVVGGDSLDLRPFLRGGESGEEGEPATPFTITTRDGGVDLVRVQDDLYLIGATGEVTHDGAVVRSADLAANLPSGQAVFLTVAGRPDGRDVVLRTEDAGELLRAVGWVDTVVGGNMVLEASIDDDEPGRPAFGVARIEDFQVIQGSVLARVLTLASFQGIQDVVAGNDGITFRQLEIPFRLTEEALDVKNARARGSALGILAEGRIDRAALTIDMAGEVAPAHTLNSLLGNIPIIGDVLTGGGEGIFAATYKVRGPLDDPTVTVNPLSVLTPGFTRRILSGFEGGLGSGEKTDYVVDTPGEN